MRHEIYQERHESGLKEGHEYGLKEGHESGLKEGQLKIAKKMKDEQMDLEIIARMTGLSMEEIKKL